MKSRSYLKYFLQEKKKLTLCKYSGKSTRKCYDCTHFLFPGPVWEIYKYLRQHIIIKCLPNIMIIVIFFFVFFCIFFCFLFICLLTGYSTSYNKTKKLCNKASYTGNKTNIIYRVIILSARLSRGGL